MLSLETEIPEIFWIEIKALLRKIKQKFEEADVEEA